MQVYFQKARELGRLILESDEAGKLAEAYASGADVAQAENDYRALVEQVIGMIKATVYEDGMEEGGHCGGCSRKNNRTGGVV